MARSQREKGARRERGLVNLHRHLGIHAERVPLSGATRYRGGGHDIDIYPYGRDHGAVIAEVKARKDGAGFKQLDRWLGDNDLLFLWRDRQDPMVLLPWRVWKDLPRLRP